MALQHTVLQRVAVCCSELLCVAECLTANMRMYGTATYCVAACCSMLQRAIVCCRVFDSKYAHVWHCNILQRIAKLNNLRQHTATDCNTLQHIATHCNTLQHTATHCNTLQHTATHCNTLQHTATHCNTLQHTADGHLFCRTRGGEA